MLEISQGACLCSLYKSFQRGYNAKKVSIQFRNRMYDGLRGG